MIPGNLGPKDIALAVGTGMGGTPLWGLWGRGTQDRGYRIQETWHWMGDTDTRNWCDYCCRHIVTCHKISSYNFTKYLVCHIFLESTCKIQFNGHDTNVACHIFYMSHVIHVTCHKYKHVLHVTCHTCYMSQI